MNPILEMVAHCGFESHPSHKKTLMETLKSVMLAAQQVKRVLR